MADDTVSVRRGKSSSVAIPKSSPEAKALIESRQTAEEPTSGRKAPSERQRRAREENLSRRPGGESRARSKGLTTADKLVMASLLRRETVEKAAEVSGLAVRNAQDVHG